MSQTLRLSGRRRGLTGAAAVLAAWAFGAFSGVVVMLNFLGGDRASSRSDPQLQSLLATSAGSGSGGELGQSRCPNGHEILVASSTAGNQLCRFLEFSLRQGMSPKILGYAHPWLGFGSKVEWVIEELKRIPPDCAVTVADSDIIFQDGFDEIQKRLSGSLGKPDVLLGADCGCYPQRVSDLQACRSFPPSPTAYRFVNGGFVMGSASGLLTVYQKAVDETKRPDNLNDQEELNYMYLSADSREKLGMALDVYGDVVNIMHSVKGCPAFQNFTMQSGRWFNEYTGRAPVALHFNGFTKDVASLYARRLRKAIRRRQGEQAFDQATGAVLASRVRLDKGRGSVPFYSLCPSYTEMYDV